MNIVTKHIIPELGYHQLKKITPLMIQKFYSRKIEDGYSPGFIKNIHAILCKTLKTATEWEYISKNIAPLVKPPRIPKRKVEVWSMETANLFLTLVEKRRFFIAYVLGIYTGMRKGEILGLRWKDCDLEEGKISIQQTLAKVRGKLTFQEPKTSGSERTITLPHYATSCLKNIKLLRLN